MTLPTTGNLTFAMIKAEFNKPNATGLRDFLGETASPNNLPSSGIIKMSDFRGLSAQRTFIITLGNRNNVTTADLWNEFFPNDQPTSKDSIDIVVPAGVVIGSSSSGTPAFRHNMSFQNTPANVWITVQGRIQGAGGKGGAGGANSAHLPGYPGAAGGTAMYIFGTFPLPEIRGSGQIWGGGGGGGGGATPPDGAPGYGSVSGGGGGGGAGTVGGGGGTGGSGASHNGSNGGVGTSTAGGGGARGGYDNGYHDNAGGNGGGPGLAGASGQSVQYQITTKEPIITQSGGSGGAAGPAIEKDLAPNVSVATSLDVRGAVINV